MSDSLVSQDSLSNILIEIFNNYFNKTLNNSIYKNDKKSYEYFEILHYKRGSFYEIKIKSYNKVSNILQRIYNNPDVFQNVIINLISELNSKYNVNILINTIDKNIFQDLIILSFYRCYGMTCSNFFNFVVGKSHRAGIIPYFNLYGTEYIILGVKDYVEGIVYTDFGGGCKERKKEQSYHCAIRELNEESLGVIKNGTLTHIYSNEYIANDEYEVKQVIYFTDYTKNLIITGNINIDRHIFNIFSMQYRDLLAQSRISNPELKDIIVMEYKEFKTLPINSLAENLKDFMKLLPDKLIE